MTVAGAEVGVPDMSGLPLPAIQVLQVLTVAAGAPGISGFIAWFEARLQGRRGPRILQPYYDIAKLFGKQTLAPAKAGPFFLLEAFTGLNPRYRGAPSQAGPFIHVVVNAPMRATRARVSERSAGSSSTSANRACRRGVT